MIVKGYNDMIPSYVDPRAPASALPYLFVLTEAREYLKPSRRGAVCFTRFPLKMRDMVEAQVEAAKRQGNRAHPAIYIDTVDKCVVHVFCITVATMTEIIDRDFRKVADTAKIYHQYVPAIEFIVDASEDGLEAVSKYEPTSLRYFLLRTEI